ncbi:hypothetical protein GCM10022252_20430 [Streptosporangium oxazolinicum]|uniref:Uncharacterized protein n=1 Tax=Streptosporangium oxazolinicum TaxID=909287 RepID=A0ABP8APR9_9ACTN
MFADTWERALRVAGAPDGTRVFAGCPERVRVVARVRVFAGCPERVRVFAGGLERVRVVAGCPEARARVFAGRPEGTWTGARGGALAFAGAPEGTRR